MTENKYPKIDAALAALDIVYDAEFIPWSKSRNAAEQSPVSGKVWPTLNWKIKLGKTSSQGVIRWGLETDYGQGIGHYPDYIQNVRKSSYDQRIYEQMLAKGAEDGIWYDWINANDSIPYRAKLWTQGEAQAAGYNLDKDIGFNTKIRRKIPKPSLREVMYCLLSDADVLNHPTYESWARDLGYDPDSIKGEKIYRDCLKIALQLQSLLGAVEIEKLREIYNEEGY